MFLQQLVFGVAIGSTYALVAVGFSLVFGILELINFANGAFVLTGAYLAIVLLFTFNFPVVPAILLAMILTGGLGYLMELFALRPIRSRGQSPIAALICTVAVSMIIVNLQIAIFGSEARPFPDVFRLGSFFVGNVVVPWLNVIILSVTIIQMTFLTLIVHKTELGAAMRATAQNRQAARLMGINVNKIIAITFFLGTSCVALAGVLIGMSFTAVDYGMASELGIRTFAAAILGGAGSLPGAMIGGLLIGMAESLVAGYIGTAYRDAVAFVVLVLVLLFRPAGLFGKEILKKV